MYPHLLKLPAILVAMFAGGMFGAILSAGAMRGLWVALTIAAGAVIAGLYGYSQPWGAAWVPVQGYGVMILLGFLCGVWMAARRAQLLGVAPRHCVDIGVYGVVLGLFGSRLFHIIMHWGDFDPFQASGFDVSRLVGMVKLWEGGLVFYGAFIVALPYTWSYCRYFKLPALPFLDMAVPSLMAGLAFGRIGCLLNGCCFGKVTALPWGIVFPEGSPVYEWQKISGLPQPTQWITWPVHPTQIYASIAAGLTAAFLYAYWPHRKYDGQILSLMLIMAGATRFFEEILRTDEPAAFPSLAGTFTIAQWFALLFVVLGTALLFYFRWRRTYFKPALPAVS